MRTIIISLAMLSLLSTIQSGPAETADLAKLQGEWQMVSSARDGTDLPAESVKAGRRVCKDNQTTVTVGAMLILKASFTLDASKSPKAIDYDLIDGPYKGKKQLGIYKIEETKDGQQATFCFSPPDKPRPDDFKSEAGDGRTLSVWKKSEEHGR